MALRFEWNPEKAAGNLAKHEVSFEEAATVFGDLLGRIVDDPRHSVDEPRYVLLGQSERQRLLAVMFAERAEGIRVMRARKATRRERREYEEGEK
ncbi:MAG: BrnT family toxin [Terriglobales bacterium]